MILVTGAYGFVGFQVVKSLASPSLTVLAAVRNAVDLKLDNIRWVSIGDFANFEDFSSILSNVSVVVHVAAIAHKQGVSSEEYTSINTRFTIDLAKHAIKHDVQRFIFISSIGVNGQLSSRPFNEIDNPLPHNHFALSKYEAEKQLFELVRNTEMEVTIIRPPLVYGPNPPGNFGSLIKLVKKEFPLPFGFVVNNKRSLIALDNLVDFILLCADYKKTPQAANQTFVISDGEDVSTAELFQKVAKAYGKKSRLFPFPVWLLRLGARLAGKQAMADRLLGSLQVDSSKARELLGWKPVITMDEQLQKMAAADLTE